jgi:hypothetical protein
MWTQKLPMQPNRHFKLRDHVLLFYSAFHDRNIPVDFARLVKISRNIKLSLLPPCICWPRRRDLLKLYVQNGGTLVSTFTPALWMGTISPRIRFPN